MRGVRAIKSRASTKSRFRLGQLPAVVGTPPILTFAPEMHSGFWGSGTDTIHGPNVYNSTTGLIIQGYNGDWDETGGATVVTGGFYDELGNSLGGTPILIEGIYEGLELEIEVGQIGRLINYTVVATRGGVSVSQTAAVRILILSSAPEPAVGGFSTLAPSVVRAGLPISKPNYAWTAGAIITPITIVGEWYRNEVATGVTGELFPDPDAVNPLGQTTVEGDIIRWQETCTNAADISNTSPVATGFQTLISDLIPDLRINLRSQVADRIAGLPGGTANMDVFSTVNYQTGEVVFNENNWCADLRYQLSAHCVNQRFRPPLYNGLSARYGFFLITPRHILTASHIGPMSDFRYVRFLTHDNRLVEARCQTVVTSKELFDLGVTPTGGDMQIILLDRDMAAEGLHILPMARFSQAPYHSRWYYIAEAGDDFPLIGVSQDGVNQPAGALGAINVALGIPVNHKRMLFTKIPRSFYSGFDQFPSEYDGFQYEPYRGDSGGPIMMLAYGKFFVLGVHYDGSMNSAHFTHGDELIALPDMIARADAKAVAQGFLDAPTGLLPTYVDIENLEAFPVPTPVQDRLLLLSEADPVALLVSEADPTPILLPFHY